MNLSRQDKVLLCYFGHHKCASTWIMRILYDVCASLRLKSFEKQIILLENPKETMAKERPDFYFCQTSDYKKVLQLPPFKGFHVIRDPRDIIVSGYYSHLYSHATKDWPELANHREKLKNLDKTNGLVEEIEFSKQFIDHIGEWNYKKAHILELKYEDLVDNPFGKMQEIFIHLGLYESEGKDLIPQSTLTINKVLSKIGLKSHAKRLSLNDSLIDALIKKHSFNKLSGGRDRGVSDDFSHYRKGISGDWKNHFEVIHKEKFKELYGDIVVKLGYEHDNHW
jgi:hypothetical protein